MSKRTNAYPSEVREAALARIRAGERPADVARDMKLPRGSIYTWTRRWMGKAPSHGRAPVSPPELTTGARMELLGIVRRLMSAVSDLMEWERHYGS